MAFSVRAEEKQAGVFSIYPSGSLDADSSPMLQQKVDSLLDSAARVIVFDLGGLEYISSAGIRVFLQAKKAMKARAGKFALMNIQPPIRKVFDIINSLPSFTVFESVAELDEYLDAMQKSVTSGEVE